MSLHLPLSQYDSDWNAQIDQQAQARVHRLGQTKKVKRSYLNSLLWVQSTGCSAIKNYHPPHHQVLVIRFVTVGSVEERVISVARSKQALVDRSITCAYGRKARPGACTSIGVALVGNNVISNSASKFPKPQSPHTHCRRIL